MNGLFFYIKLFNVIIRVTHAFVFVKYEIQQQGSKLFIPCAVEGLFTHNTGVVWDDMPGSCTVLSAEEISLIPEEATLLKRRAAIYFYKEGWPQIKNETYSIWEFPGNFGIGARLEVYFNIPYSEGGSIYLSIWTDRGIILIEIALLQTGIIRMYSKTEPDTVGLDVQTTLVEINNNQTYIAVFEARETGLKADVDTLTHEVDYLDSPENAISLHVDKFGYIHPFPYVTKIVFQGI